MAEEEIAALKKKTILNFEPCTLKGARHIYRTSLDF
jgi:hypothetical protein